MRKGLTMKNTFLLCLFILFSKLSFGQQDSACSLSLFVSPQINYRYYKTNSEQLKWLKDINDSLQTTQSGFHLQAQLNSPLRKNYSLFTGVRLDKLGYKYRENALSGITNYSLNYTIIELPIGINYTRSTNEALSLHSELGMLPGVLFNSRAIYRTTNSKGDLLSPIYPGKKFFLGVQLAGGISVNLQEAWLFNADLFYQLQLSNFYHSEVACKLFSAGIRVGLTHLF